MPPNDLSAIIEAMERAAKFAATKDDEASLRAYRSSTAELITLIYRSYQGETLRMLLISLRGLAVSALITGRVGEGRLALGTGLLHADLGLKRWVDAPPLLKEKAVLLKLAEKVGGEQACPVLVHDDDVEQVRWPYDD